MPTPNTEKLQKVLARLGVASRRECERMIADGRVTVNGEAAHTGMRVGHKARISVDGRVVASGEAEPQATKVLLYHKPAGEICTRNDPQGRPTVFDRLPKLDSGRWLSIGRLDLNTSGLLLFTNDGELAHKIMHPSTGFEREYAVRILGMLTEDMMKQLTSNVQLEDGPARFEHIVSSGGTGANRWYHLVVMEGRNRLVRRMFEHFHLAVSRLTRVRFGPVILPHTLSTGRYMDLPAEQLAKLKELTQTQS